MAHIRQSRPESGLDFQVIQIFQVVASSLGSGQIILKLTCHLRGTNPSTLG